MNVEWGREREKTKQNEKSAKEIPIPKKREFFTPISCIYNHAFGRVPELELTVEQQL